MITIVSGIPRSGTSLMMQMLSAGGMPVLTDLQRSADTNNPLGYFEVEMVKSLSKNAEIISQAEGKAVKVISSLLKYLPPKHEYRIVFMRRQLEEIISSQDRMLERLGQKIPATPKGAVIKAFQQHLEEIKQWLANQSNMKVLYVQHAAVLEGPSGEALRVAQFLDCKLDVVAMESRVERSLHREKVAAS